jgi:hypothetical protein
MPIPEPVQARESGTHGQFCREIKDMPVVRTQTVLVSCTRRTLHLPNRTCIAESIARYRPGPRA